MSKRGELRVARLGNRRSTGGLRVAFWKIAFSVNCIQLASFFRRRPVGGGGRFRF